MKLNFCLCTEFQCLFIFLGKDALYIIKSRILRLADCVVRMENTFMGKQYINETCQYDDLTKLVQDYITENNSTEWLSKSCQRIPYFKMEVLQCGIKILFNSGRNLLCKKTSLAGGGYYYNYDFN